MIWCGIVHAAPANNHRIVRDFAVSVYSAQGVREE